MTISVTATVTSTTSIATSTASVTVTVDNIDKICKRVGLESPNDNVRRILMEFVARNRQQLVELIEDNNPNRDDGTELLCHVGGRRFFYMTTKPLPPMPLPMRLKDAKRARLKMYWPGVTCRYGHAAMRYTSSDLCVACKAEGPRKGIVGPDVDRWPVKTRDQARAADENKYWTGTPCVHGHRAPRYTVNGICCVCAIQSITAYNERRKASL